ncbi:MAG: hypothetical protein AAGD07_07380 [Planctomycetota bacterium]
MATIPLSGGSQPRVFRKIADAFFGREGLPFADVISAHGIAEVFAKHFNLFGGRGVYNTALKLWSFLGQVLRDGKEASCQSAVARVVNQTGVEPPTSDIGDYRRASQVITRGHPRALGASRRRDAGGC